MASNAVRRPLPALLSLVALLLLTGLVWWRVIDRDDATTHTASRRCATSSTPSDTPAVPAPPTTTLPKPNTVRILVLNSTKRTGIAADARTGLQAAGFRSPQQAANYLGKATIAGVGELRFGAASKGAAQLLRYYLPGMALVQTSVTSPLVTVVLGPKYDSVLSTAQVDKSLATQRATTSNAPSSTTSSSISSTTSASTPSC